MNRRDVSFTFLHRVEEIEWNIEDSRWQSALALALTIPDICGGIAFPELVKRYRDGRIMLDRQKNPTRDVGAQYIEWFNVYAASFFKQSATDKSPYICGERCWQLRCEYLHQNKGFFNDDEVSDVRFHLGVNCGTSICQSERFVTVNGDRTDIRIDIEQFCWRMCQAARSYYETFHEEKDFSLYNTPVLDFIKFRQGIQSNRMIALVCSNTAYAKSLQLSLENITNRIQIFETQEAAKNKLKKMKPALWIVVDFFGREEKKPWWMETNTPVILLTGNGARNQLVQAEKQELTIITMPASLDELRKSVQDYLR